MIKITMQIHMDEGETTDCPFCERPHKIKLEDIAVLLGECEVCDMGIILEVTGLEKGTKQ